LPEAVGRKGPVRLLHVPFLRRAEREGSDLPPAIPLDIEVPFWEVVEVVEEFEEGGVPPRPLGTWVLAPLLCVLGWMMKRILRRRFRKKTGLN